jgi:hypothetical protein
MSVRRSIFAAALAMACAAGGMALAQQAKQPLPPAGRTPVPVPHKGKGDRCVAPTEWMRRNHMTVLNHQRDRTVHEGIRTKQFSLKGCVECHAVPGRDGEPVGAADPRHFCRSCHDYAAVAIDCFECHASRPPRLAQGASPTQMREYMAVLHKYLEGLGR